MDLLTSFNISLMLVAGVFSGLAAGLMGVGGGLVNVPALYFIFKAIGYPDAGCWYMATGTSLGIIILTSLSSARTHLTHGNVISKVALFTGFGGAAGAFIAVQLAVLTPDRYLRIAFAVVLYAAAVRLILKKQPEQSAAQEMTLEIWRLIIIGFGGGMLAGFFGIGGGLVAVPLFMLWAKMSPHKSVGTSSAMVVITAFFGAARYAFENPDVSLPYTLGYVNGPAWIVVSCSSIIAAHFGAKIATGAKPRTLTVIFAIGLIIVGTRMLF